jgi:hypothetical protein
MVSNRNYVETRFERSIFGMFAKAGMRDYGTGRVLTTSGTLAGF